MARPVFIFSTIAALTVLLDQLTKGLLATLRPEWNVGILSIHLVTNTGAGFGILQGKTMLLAVISLIVAVVILLSYRKIEKETMPQVLYGLLLGGVLGNLIDRLWLGSVRDFIDLSFWPAFNLADAAITMAVFGLVAYYWKKGKDDS